MVDDHTDGDSVTNESKIVPTASLFLSVQRETPIAFRTLEDMAEGRVPIEHEPIPDDPEWTALKEKALANESNTVTAGHLETEIVPGDSLLPERKIDRAFMVKDSGRREEYDNGFVRDTEDGKEDITDLFALADLELIPVDQLERWLEHMRKGAVKYGPNNWTRANNMEAVQRFRRSAARHFAAWMRGEEDEDHASAIVFNVWAAEHTTDKLRNGLTQSVE